MARAARKRCSTNDVAARGDADSEVDSVTVVPMGEILLVLLFVGGDAPRCRERLRERLRGCLGGDGGGGGGGGGEGHGSALCL